MFAGALLCVLPVGAQPERVLLRYDLRPGDHLVYRQQIEGAVAGTVSSKSRTEWHNHVLVLSENEGKLILGFQRNRRKADLLEYTRNGQDLREQLLKRFESRLHSKLAEANRLTPNGWPDLPWLAAREEPSQILFELQEIEELTDRPVAVGDQWKGHSAFGFPFRAAAWEELGRERCLRIEGGEGTPFRVRYWFCLQSGLLRRAEFTATYGLGGGGTSTERITLEFIERARDESLARWLDETETRLGALAALRLVEESEVPREKLYALLSEDDPAVQRAVLSLAFRRRLEPPPADLLNKLTKHSDSVIGRIAARLLGKNPAQLQRVAAASVGGCPAQPLQPRTYTYQPPGYTIRTLPLDSEFAGWPYVVYVPPDYRGDEPFPLIIYLSGGGGRALDGVWTSFRTLTPASYLAILPQSHGYWWKDLPGRATYAVLEEVLQRFNVDTNRVYLTGLSNGGTGAMFYASYWTDRFAAVVPMMGAGFSPPGDDDPPLAANLAHLPMLFLHGEKDSTIPPRYSEDAIAAIRRVSSRAPVQLKILSNRPHNVLLDTDDGFTIPFFEQHVRDPLPREFRFHTRDLRFPRRFWVELLDKEDGIAEVEAEIRDDNSVRLKTRRVRRLRLLFHPDLLPDSTKPMQVIWNRKEVFEGTITPDCELFAESAQRLADPYRGFAAELTFDLPR